MNPYDNRQGLAPTDQELYSGPQPTGTYDASTSLLVSPAMRERGFHNQYEMGQNSGLYGDIAGGGAAASGGSLDSGMASRARVMGYSNPTPAGQGYAPDTSKGRHGEVGPDGKVKWAPGAESATPWGAIVAAGLAYKGQADYVGRKKKVQPKDLMTLAYPTESGLFGNVSTGSGRVR